MAVTDDQYQRLLNRLAVLENSFNDVVIALENFITRSQYNQLHALLETENDDISNRIDELNDRVTMIENEPLT